MRGRRLLPLVAAASALLIGGCRQGLYNQQKLKPLRPSALFSDGSSARPLPAGTVPRGFLREDRVLWAAQGPDGKFVTEIPVPVTKALLLRGRERYEIFCSPCHGRTGDGTGMIVQRGFKRPASFHVERLRNERIGYFFDVVTNGFGVMPDYRTQIPIADRWAIVSYVRALQLSGHATIEEVPPSERGRLEGAGK